MVFSRGGTAFAVLAPRAAKAASLRLGSGNGLGQRLARLKAKGLMGAVHADVKLIKADGSSNAFASTAVRSPPRFGHVRLAVKRADGERYEEHLGRHEAPRQARRGRQGRGVLEGERGDGNSRCRPQGVAADVSRG